MASHLFHPSVLGVEYCTGYVDDQGQWKKGFYCPKKADGVASVEKSKDIFCCGSQTSKFCCEKKEGFTTTSSGYYVSFGTMISVTSVAFVLAVLLTALAFICCRRYWKERDRNLEFTETTFYRMACASATSDVPLVNSGPYSLTFDPSNDRLTRDLLASYQSSRSHEHNSITTSSSLGRLNHHHQQQINSRTGISVIELPGYPPPPYRSRTSINDLELNSEPTESATIQNRNQRNNNVHNHVHNVTSDASHDTDPVSTQPQAIVVRKPFWRKLSQ